MATPLTEITLPIAQKNESNKRKSTSQQTFPITEIFAVTSPEGMGGKGALIYIANRKEPLQTAQTFSYKDWQTEIERIDEETGEGIYIYAFKQITPRLMVNLLAINIFAKTKSALFTKRKVQQNFKSSKLLSRKFAAFFMFE